MRDDAHGEVTVWVVVHDGVHGPDAGHVGHRRDDFATRITAPAVAALPELGFADAFDDLD